MEGRNIDSRFIVIALCRIQIIPVSKVIVSFRGIKNLNADAAKKITRFKKGKKLC